MIMDELPILHVSVEEQPTEQELKRVRSVLRDELPKYQIIVTDGGTDLHEVPALDDYADELADRVADRLSE